MDSVEIRFTTSRSELARALRAINGAIPRVRLMRRIAWLALVVVAGLVITGVLAPIDSVLFFFVPALVLGLFWSMPLYFARMAWKNSPFWTSPQTWRLSPAGLECLSGGLEGRTAWGAIVRLVETRDFLLFFTSDSAAQFLPARAFTPDALISVRELSNQHIGQASRSTFAPVERATPDVEAVFELDPNEAARAGMLALRRTRSLWTSYAVVIGVVGWNTVPPLYTQWRRGGLGAINLPLLGLGLAPLVIVLLTPALAGRWAARRHMATAPSATGAQRVGVATWGLQLSGPFYSGSLDWTTLMRADETGEFFLFHVSKLHPLFIPKRVLSAPQIARVRELAHNGLGANARILAS